MNKFDPYYKWLAIPPKDQPPNYYRLLALEVFESDRDVISTAADQRMMLVRSFQTGDNQRFSQQILNEIAVARLCLLDAERKAKYDSQLQPERIPTAQPVRLTTAGAKPPRLTVATAGATLTVDNNGGLTKPRRHAGTPSQPLVWGLAAMGMLIVVIGLIYMFRSGATGDSTEKVAQDSVATAPAPPRDETRPRMPPESADNVQQVAPPPAASVLRLRQIPPQRIDEGSPLRLQVSLEEQPATGTDDIRFLLGPGAPVGLTIDSGTGVLTWQPTEEQGPGQYTVAIAATDGMLQSDTTVAIEVVEVNEPPQIRSVPDQSGVPGQPLQLTIDATDSDLPRQSLSYELIGAPPDATLDGTTGKFTWTPRSENAGQNYEARVRAKDSAAGHADAVVILRVGQPASAGTEPDPARAAKGDRHAVPSPEAVQAAMQQVQKLFAGELAKAGDNPALRLKLVENFVKEADGATDDLVGRYVLYRQAIQQARLAGQASAMLQAIDALAKWYDVDALEEKQQAVSELSKSVRSEDAASELVATTLALVDEAVEKENWDQAANFIRIATVTVPKTRDAERRKAVATRARELGAIKKMFGDAQQANEVLRRDAQDAASHRIVGTYQALFRGDWESGLPHLVQGDDISLANAAKKELENPTESAAMKEVAEAWAAILKNKHAATPTSKALDSIAPARNRLGEHALKWYEAALPGLTGLSKRAAEQQIGALKESLAHGEGASQFKAITFDFGTATSPLEEGAVRIAGQSGYERQPGYGFVGNPPASVDRAAPATTALRRDFCYAPDMTFGVDVPAGMYSVTVMMGDVGFPCFATEVWLEGAIVGTSPAQAANGPFSTLTFRVKVTDGQLTLRLKKQGTAAGNAKINGLTVKKVP